MHGILASIPLPLLFLTLGFACLALAYLEASLLIWSGATILLLMGMGAPGWLTIAAALFLAAFNLRPIRRVLFTSPVMGLMRALKFLPVISRTEREALEAGTVWADGELFSGKPDFERLIAEGYPALTPEEQAFLDGPVEEVCRMTDDWQTFQRRDLAPEVWNFLKREKFFGLIIPEEYGGLGFGPSANSAIVAKLSSRSGPLGITVMVPNSLGPAELLVHYGTKEQRAHYLPRLADGREMPCFALTEPGAGSDAGAISAEGEVFRGDDGEVYMRLGWNKRYITLASVATLVGLAFKLRDPNQLLGKGVDIGITCALIPAETAGIDLSQRHDPLGVPFYNCPTLGHDVVVPVDCIIGGPEGAGAGWKMLMECLSAGRGISLPASATATTLMSARVAGAYAAVRKQFGLSIGKFEGIEEPLARIGGYAYILEAARRYTCGGLDGGAKPAVVTAMAKYNFTELARKAVQDAMDVQGGAAISRGPRNLLAHAYQAMPISVTVEGANILTRTLMIFGQGAIRCHPYAYTEITTLEENDVKGFDTAFWGHVGHVVRNSARSVVLSLTRGTFAHSPVTGPHAVYFKKLAWSSASFALLADVAMASLGGDLKRKETLTGRFSDIFSWMYLGNTVLRRFEAEGRREEDVAVMRWSMEYALARIQEGFDGLFTNLDVPLIGTLLRGPIALWSRVNSLGSGPSDELGSQVARMLQVPGEQRDRLTPGMYVPEDPEQALGRLERAFRACHDAESVARKLKKAIRAKQLPRLAPALLIERAVEEGVITRTDAERVARAEAARSDAIQVDSFTLDEYLATALADDEDGESSGVSLAS
ncbi:MAG: acyl-CoA dehydrogenase [bacterium]|nr:acyl-CoA dehydrogenase [bacterium]